MLHNKNIQDTAAGGVGFTVGMLADNLNIVILVLTIVLLLFRIGIAGLELWEKKKVGSKK